MCAGEHILADLGSEAELLCLNTCMGNHQNGKLESIQHLDNSRPNVARSKFKAPINQLLQSRSVFLSLDLHPRIPWPALGIEVHPPSSD